MSETALRIEDLPHYTYDDYAQWEGKWELICGIPYAMTPAPAMKHQRISFNIAFQLETLIKNRGCCKAYQAIDWQIREDTVVQPDVLVICGDYVEKEKLSIPPVIVFEILSPSTSRNDRTLKYMLYLSAGVNYYCIVDPETDSADVFTLNTGRNDYEKKGDFKDGKITFDLGAIAIDFDFARIF